jgi:hypothetical protein
MVEISSSAVLNRCGAVRRISEAQSAMRLPWPTVTLPDVANVSTPRKGSRRVNRSRFLFERTAMKLQPIVLTFALTLTSSLAYAESQSGGGSAESAASRSARSAGAPFASDALRANGTRMPGPNAPTRTSSQDADDKINTENRRLDNAVKSICRGC